MKKSLLLAGVFVCWAAFAATAEAKDDDYGWINLSVFGGGLFMQSEDVDNEIIIGARATYDITTHLEAGVETGWYEYEVDLSTGGPLGDVEIVPLLAIVILKYPIPATDNRLVPYILGGGGIVFWDSSSDNPGTVSKDDDIDQAWKAGGGADFYVTDHTAVFVEGGFQSWSADRNIGESVDALYVTGGVKLSI